MQEEEGGELPMKRVSGFLVAIVVSLAVGYFAGREHLKYEVQTALQSAAENLSQGLSSAFGGQQDAELEQRASSTLSLQPNEREEDSVTAMYIAENLQLYDLSAEYKESLLDGRVPGVLFKIRNNGDRSLDRVVVTVFFKDATGSIVAEENYIPVRVSEYSFSGNNNPLKPGYIWQMEQGKFYAAKQVPSEWATGSVEAEIAEIRFSE